MQTYDGLRRFFLLVNCCIFATKIHNERKDEKMDWVADVLPYYRSDNSYGTKRAGV